MLLGHTAELAAVVGQDGADGHAEGLVERQHLVVQRSPAVIGIFDVETLAMRTSRTRRRRRYVSTTLRQGLLRIQLGHRSI